MAGWLVCWLIMNCADVLPSNPFSVASSQEARNRLISLSADFFGSVSPLSPRKVEEEEEEKGGGERLTAALLTKLSTLRSSLHLAAPLP